MINDIFFCMNLLRKIICEKNEVFYKEEVKVIW